MKHIRPAATILLAALSCYTLSANDRPPQQDRIILHTLETGPQSSVKTPIVLMDDYGFIILNDGINEPKMRVLIAHRKNKKIVTALTWKAVNEALAQIPPNSEIAFYGKCLAPTYYGLPDDTFTKFLDLAQKHRLVFNNDSSRITCTCTAQ